ncbi:hypothetical protein Dsin_009479 [Dipteronia sinensis]|uniref:Transposase-associated domain-containing protein n=1 Tax=Dipteronia sinensis TaxID=43782 RepID=A0AAE0ARV8_9ROSI|nr:hypothetical protein Dsin_009479 [Dipteronia sinensis]
MDRSWILKSRVSKTYEDGVTQFLDFAFANSIDGRLKCPCKNCNSTFRRDRNTVKEHMICDGLDIGYFSNKWIYHGELDSTQARLNTDQSVQVDDMHGMLHNAFGVDIDGGKFDGVDLSGLDHDNNGSGDENDNGGDREIPNDDARRFYNLLKDAEQELYPGYPRNVRLGLASDGFNPFGTMSISHNTWSVVLMIYNLPPWMCMKQPKFIMSLLIPGPSAPGNDIDVYLEPLIDELKDPEGNEPDKITIFKATYTRKKDKPIDPKVANAMRQMDELVTNQPDASKNEIFNQVLGEVIGPKADVSTLTYGLGITRSKKNGKRSSHIETLKMLQDERIQREAASEKIKHLETELTSMKSQLQTMEEMKSQFRELMLIVEQQKFTDSSAAS